MVRQGGRSAPVLDKGRHVNEHPCPTAGQPRSEQQVRRPLVFGMLGVPAWRPRSEAHQCRGAQDEALGHAKGRSWLPAPALPVLHHPDVAPGPGKERSPHRARPGHVAQCGGHPRAKLRGKEHIILELHNPGSSGTNRSINHCREVHARWVSIAVLVDDDPHSRALITHCSNELGDHFRAGRHRGDSNSEVLPCGLCHRRSHQMALSLSAFGRRMGRFPSQSLARSCLTCCLHVASSSG